MDLYDVYRLIVEAAAWGGDVSGAVELFNMALDAPEPLRGELLYNASLAARRALEEAQWGAAFNILLTAGVVVFTILLLKNYKRLLRLDKGEPAGGEAGAPTRRGEAAAALLIIYLILAAAVVSNGAKWHNGRLPRRPDPAVCSSGDPRARRPGRQLPKRRKPRRRSEVVHLRHELYETADVA
ncbi:MAG: hypothetical protein QXS16_03845 [Pyrobaculum sp.]